MVFSSLTFLCLFLPVVLLLHTVVPNIRFRNGLLLAASLLFYAWGEPVWILAMLLCTAMNYACALWIARTENRRKRRIALAAGVCISLAALVYFKYSAFFVNSVCALVGTAYRMTPPALPIGISFYTFQIITYTVDVYRGEAPVQKNPFRLLLYVSLFPQLIAGPIVRYGDIAEQLETRKVRAGAFGEGFFRFALGLGKKVLLANLCGEVLAKLPAAGELSTASGWLAALLFALQLYFDFAGYSDMAIGIGGMTGFRFPENFDAPYVSQNISEFWRRWHISLGTFFREYVYIPLGGNRVSRGRWILNTAVVWALTGIWHGASWNYLLWGLYFGVLIVLERTVLKNVLSHTPRIVKHLVTLLLVTVGFVLFRNESFADLFAQLRAMFAPWSVPLTDDYAIYAIKSNVPLLVVSILCCLPLRKTVRGWFERRRAEGKPVKARPFLKAGLCVVIVGLSLLFLVGQSFNPFLYFRF